MANRQLVLGLVLATAVLVVLAGATAYYLTRPSGEPVPVGAACAGNETYSGSVHNDTQAPVPEVVVALSPAPPNAGLRANVTTDASGAWSARVSGGCAYDAGLYWQSAADGPLLAEASNLTATSALTVHVAWQPATLTFLAEYPHDANATVTVTVPAGFSIFVDANASGNLSLGFLPTDGSGHPGYNFTVEAMTAAHTSPFALEYTGAHVYRIQDAGGDVVVYATPTPGGAFGTVSATDPLTMTQAIDLLLAQNTYPYVQVARGIVEQSYWHNVTDATHAPLGTAASAFGATLWAYFTVPANRTLFLRLEVTLTNPSNRDQCFVLDMGLVEAHVWHYGVGACPP